MNEHNHRLTFPLPCRLLLGCCLLLCFTTIAQAEKLRDHDGNVFTLSAPFTRIISLYPAHTENLAEMGAAGRLIGISTSADYPPAILSKKRFSYHDSAEKFIAAAPDCILIRPMIRRAKSELIEKLESFGITVISLQPTSADELYSYWHSLGRISGREEAAAQMTARFKQQLAILRDNIAAPEESRPRVYFEAIHARMRTFAPRSIAIFCLENAGGINIAADAGRRNNTNIASYSKEKILDKAGSIDVYLAQSGRMNRITIGEIISEPGFGALKAVQNRRVYLVPETLVSRPTTRLLEGIELISRYIYSETPYREN